MIMPLVIGQASRELIYTGDTIGADEALRLGLVNRVFPSAELEHETMKIARRISRVALAPPGSSTTSSYWNVKPRSRPAQAPPRRRLPTQLRDRAGNDSHHRRTYERDN